MAAPEKVLQVAAENFALSSNRIVIGLPLEPLFWIVAVELNVPQRWTVSPGPILPLDLGFAQLLDVLNQVRLCAFAQSAPVLPPLDDDAM